MNKITNHAPSKRKQKVHQEVKISSRVWGHQSMKWYTAVRDTMRDVDTNSDGANGDPILNSSREGGVLINGVNQVPGPLGKRKGKPIAKEMQAPKQQ